MCPMIVAPLLVLGLTNPPPPAAVPRPVVVLRDTAEVLDEFRELHLKHVPPALLAEARGVVVVPHTVKAGFVVGGRRGRGVAFRRTPDGTWGGPTFVTLTGISAGLQVGVESTDLVLVFRTGRSLDRVVAGKGKLTLGADAAVAAGPVGREAAAGTDARLGAEIYSYSRGRGLFAGVALEGAVLAYDRSDNWQFGHDPRPDTARAVEEVKRRLLDIAPPRPVLPPPDILGPPEGPRHPR